MGMVIGGGKTKALRNQRRRNRRKAAGRPGAPNQDPQNRRGKVGHWLRRILAMRRRR